MSDDTDRSPEEIRREARRELARIQAEKKAREILKQAQKRDETR